MMRIRIANSLILLLLVAGTAAAQLPVFIPGNTAQLEDLQGKILLLRGFYGGPSLHYDSNGSLLQGGRPESWTLAGVKIMRLKRHHGIIEMEARRVGLLYDGKQFQPVERESIGVFNSRKPDYVTITIDAPRTQATAPVIQRVFLTEHDYLQDLVPEYWRDFVGKVAPTRPEPAPVCGTTVSAGEAKNCAATGAVVQQAETREEKVGRPVPNDFPQKALRVGGAVSAPRPTYTPDPDYVDAARAAKIQGTDALWVVVGSDGTVRSVRIVRPLGFGMDDNAVAAVSKWQFKPAMKDGQPVTVQVHIEVNFRLF